METPITILINRTMGPLASNAGLETFGWLFSFFAFITKYANDSV